jgi:hypothetical protein
VTWTPEHQKWYDAGRRDGYEGRRSDGVPAGLSGFYNAGHIHGHNDRMEGKAPPAV